MGIAGRCRECEACHLREQLEPWEAMLPPSAVSGGQLGCEPSPPQPAPSVQAESPRDSRLPRRRVGRAEGL